MIEQKSGVIINISTDAAKQPIWEMTMSYSSAKAALNTYSKALATLVAFLASPEAKYITGIKYSVDGGALPVV